MTDINEQDVIGIFWWNDPETGVKYRCRGTGKKYDDFYNKWVPKSSYRCIGVDWPWDFFVFDNHDDHFKLLNDYPNDVFEDE